MKTVSIGILGAANIALKWVLPAIQATPGVHCTAIASRRSGEATKVAAERGVPLAFDSYEALLASPEVEAVYIPVANGEHKRWTERAAAAGKHILCEKPLGLNRAEAEAMYRAAETHGVRLLEAYSYYFHPQHHRVLSLLKEGVVGTPTHFRARFSFPLTSRPGGDRRNVRLDPTAGGAGALMDIGCYGIHSARRVFASDPVAVSAHSIFSADGVDVATVATLEFSRNRLAVVEVDLSTAWCGEYEVAGEQGMIRLPRAYGNMPSGEMSIRISSPEGDRVETVPHPNQVELMVQHFRDLVLDPALPMFTSPAETLGIMRVLDACAESARTGRRITL